MLNMKNSFCFVAAHLLDCLYGAKKQLLHCHTIFQLTIWHQSLIQRSNQPRNKPTTMNMSQKIGVTAWVMISGLYRRASYQL